MINEDNPVNKSNKKNIGCGEDHNGKSVCSIRLERRLRMRNFEKRINWKALIGGGGVVQARQENCLLEGLRDTR